VINESILTEDEVRRRYAFMGQYKTCKTS